MTKDDTTIKEKKEKDNYTIYTLSSGEEIKFGNVYSHWILELYKLLLYINDERSKRNISYNMIEYEPRYEFFGLAESVLCQLLYFLANDELCNCENNRNLDFWCFHILSSEKDNQCSRLDYIQFQSAMKELKCKKFNEIIDEQFYDFNVSYWSCFESCINNICTPYESKITEEANNSQFKKIEKFFKKIYGEEKYYGEFTQKLNDNTQEFYNKFGKYISFFDKYNYLVKHLLNTGYKRDHKKDTEILEFCAAARNTIHNNGKHLKNDREIIINNISFKLEKGKFQYHDDYTKPFILAKEVFDIYLAIIDNLLICESTSEN